jgi:pimeloyl-ACP methyl ester carboxylesterase
MKFRLLFLLVVCIVFQTYCQKSIDTIQEVSIGGIRHTISVKGSNRSNPILLFLHGGPGSSVMSYGDKFTYKLRQHFIVVQWDQRETGKTREANASPEPLTLSLFTRDTKALIDTLLKRFDQRKLYLMGHSWGTALGFQIARTYPELLHAYIPICPMIHQVESERMILSMMKAKASADRNSQALAELNAVRIPFENGEQLYYHRKWLQDYNRSRKKDLQKNTVENWADTWLDLFNEASTINLMESAPELHCPVYFMLGRKDFQTNSTLAFSYYEKLATPKKSVFWFEHSGHFVPSTEPYLLQDIIIKTVLPETFLDTAAKTVQANN